MVSALPVAELDAGDGSVNLALVIHRPDPGLCNVGADSGKRPPSRHQGGPRLAALDLGAVCKSNLYVPGVGQVVGGVGHLLRGGSNRVIVARW